MYAAGGQTTHIATCRFGHDFCLSRLTFDSKRLPDIIEVSPLEDGSGEFFKSRKASSVDSESHDGAPLILEAWRAYQRASPGERGTSPSLSEVLAGASGTGNLHITIQNKLFTEEQRIE